MKRVLLTATFAASLAFAPFAQAGSLTDPVVESATIVEDTTGSSSGALLVVALAYLILIPVLEGR